MTYGDLLAGLKDGARVVLMIRHAERPHIDRTDPTFGETLALTPAGQAAEFTATNWIRFLESAAIIDRPDGTRRYAYIQLAR